MSEFKTYPPHYIKPGDTTRLSADNGEIEFIGIYDDSVVDFMLAFHEWEQLKKHPVQVAPSTMEYATSKIHRLFGLIPAHLKKLILERSAGGGIWIPENGDEHA